MQATIEDTVADTHDKIALIMAMGDATMEEALEALEKNGGDVDRVLYGTSSFVGAQSDGGRQQEDPLRRYASMRALAGDDSDSDKSHRDVSSSGRNSLPVASPVSPPPELLDRLRELQAHMAAIPRAIPVDQEEESNSLRLQFWIVTACLVFTVLMGIILGVALRPSAGASDSGDEPTVSPTSQRFGELKELIANVSFDGGVALNDTDSPQYQALTWLEMNANLDDYPDWRRIQRYALAVFFDCTNGGEWRRSDGWLSDADECTWFTNTDDSPVCDEEGVYISIALVNNNLKGMIPSEVALLSDSLSVLHLEASPLSGTIPTEFGLLGKLRYLGLENNALTGTIPTELARIGGFANSSIVVSLHENTLNGTVVPEIFAITSLVTLDLSNNLLTGMIPTTVGLASDLAFLSLHRTRKSDRGNELTGRLPSEIGQLSTIGRLYLSRNLLSGAIPSEIGLLTNAVDIRLEFMMIAGTLPAEIGSLTKLERLALGQNRISGTVPSEIGKLSNAETIRLFGNSLTGTLPTDIGRMEVLREIWFDGNNLMGVVPTEIGLCKDLELFTLDFNDGFTGTFITEILGLSKLEALGLSRNNFTGSIPTQIGLMTTLEYATLNSNSWSGSIPTEVGYLTSLLWLTLSGPSMEGAIPSEIGLLTSVEWLELSDIGVGGAIPSEFGKLSKLVRLDVRETKLTGTIPLELLDLTSLLQELTIENSLLTGTIPARIGTMTRLELLSFANNTLTGMIPSEVSLMTTLDILDLYGNNFSGTFLCPGFVDQCFISCTVDEDECRVLE